MSESISPSGSGDGCGYQISIAEEELIPIKNGLAAFVAGCVGGRRISNATAYRWVLKGTRGIRLPSVRVGRVLYTTGGAFSWWAQRVAETLGEEGTSGPEHDARSSRANVLGTLREAGILSRG